MDSALIVFTKSPYGHINIIEGARIAQGLLVLDKTVACVFTEDSVLSLLKNQDPGGIGLNPVKLALIYLVNLNVQFYALKDALDERGLTHSMIDEDYKVKPITVDDLTSLHGEYDTTIFL